MSVSIGSPLLDELIEQAVERYGIVSNLETTHCPGGDPFPFWDAGVPVVNLIGLPTYYHSTPDVAGVMSRPGLEGAARAAAFFIDETMKHSRDELEKGATPRLGRIPRIRTAITPSTREPGRVD